MSTEKITDRLKNTKEILPPEGLLEKIVAEMPEEIELHPALEGGKRQPLHRRWGLLAAAAAISLAVTASVSWEVYQRSLPHLRESIAEMAPADMEQEKTIGQTEPGSFEESVGDSKDQARPEMEIHVTRPQTASVPVPKTKSVETVDESGKLHPQQIAPGGREVEERLLPRRVQILDPDGAPLPGVRVSVVSPTLNEKIISTTGIDGKTAIKLPASGAYKAEVELDGFKRRELELPEPGKETSPTTKVRLSMGSVTDIVEVSPGARNHDFDDKKVEPGMRQITGGASANGLGTTVEPSLPVVDTRGVRSTKENLKGGRTRKLVAIPDPSPPAPPSTGGDKEPNAQPYGDVFFTSAGVNPFVDTQDDALSTFGLEVDTASYSVARRYLNEGHLPLPESVRVEEFLNSFDYGDAPPRRGDFRLILEGAPSAFAPGTGYKTLRVALKAREVREDQRPPAVLVFCVDVSGSMARENRLGLVKRALRELLDHLRPDDRVGLVVYGSRGRILLEPTRNHEAIDHAIARLEPGGSTNAEEGLVLAYRLLDDVSDGQEDGRIRRVILCSDGVANVGRTGADQILERVRREKESGIELSTVGFGMGNYNDVLMEGLADAGDGRYAYVDSLEEARKIFVEELTGNLMTIAGDARAQVEFDPNVVSRWRLIGYENRDIEDQRFRDPTVDAGEIGAGHSVTALYQIKLRPGASRRDFAAVLRMRYRPRGSKSFVELEEHLRVGELARRWKDGSPAFKLASQVGAFAELLRHSYWSRGLSFDKVLDRLDEIRRSPGPKDQLRELKSLILSAAGIQARQEQAKEKSD